jgi:hypothetical protein
LGSSLEFLEDVLLEWVLGQSQRTKSGGNIDDSRKYRSHVSRLTAPVRRPEKHDPIQAWAELGCEIGRVNDSLTYLLVSSDPLGEYRSTYLLGNNASETVTNEHDWPLIILGHCKHDFRLPITNRALDLLQCGS